MNITPNAFCPQLFNVKDAEAMRSDIDIIGRYDRKDGEYVPPEYFKRKRDKAWAAFKKIVVGLSIAAMIGLVVANEIANAKVMEPFYG